MLRVCTKKFAVITLSFAFIANACQFGDDGVSLGEGPAVCGNGLRESGEGCDDGNRVTGDGCSAACAVEGAGAVCGNGTKEAGEGCDDGNTRDGDGCSKACEVETSRPVCGNNVKETGEGCDDGNTRDGDGCSAACTIESPANCTTVPNMGCPAGQTCDVNSNDGTKYCRPAGTKVAEGMCTSAEQCGAGLFCMPHADGKSYCKRWCTQDSQCNGDWSRCTFDLGQLIGPEFAGHKLCTFACDPVNGTGCPGTLGCRVVPNAGGAFTECGAAGASSGACQKDSDCLSGMVCLNSGGVRQCAEYCVIGGVNTCPAGFSCTRPATALDVGPIEYGVCY